ncbi:hypothetical protein FPV67DRAFT_883172 [Lyophyllum atratum]|nr:hypothetical protein FPV67DRAFT_883172 [Lyophyllum atratum]
MMYSDNSYADADWSSSSSKKHLWTPDDQWSPLLSLPKPLPLPFPHLDQPTDISIFRFSSFNPNILNCTGEGPRRWRCSIITSPNVNTHTFFYDQNGQVFATVEWGARPAVEVRGVIPAQRTSEWIKFPANQRHMSMELHATTYTWVACGSYMSLCTTTITPVLLAGIVQEHGIVNIVMGHEALKAGLLEVSIVVAVLLLSGRDFV